MKEQTPVLLAKTMLFQIGNETTIWGITLNTIEVDEHEVDEYLADGWYTHPFHARDAQAVLERQKADEEEAERQRLQNETDEEAERQRLKRQADADADAENNLREQLLAESEKLGLKVDKRWGTKTLQEAIDEAKKTK